MRLEGKDCARCYINRIGIDEYSDQDNLRGIDILSGGCAGLSRDDWVCYHKDSPARLGYWNARCALSRTDCIFMLLTVALLFALIGLMYLRMRKNARFMRSLQFITLEA